MKTFSTFSELEASTQNKTGDTFVCTERAGAKYIVQAGGYIALAGDVTFANGRVGALQINGRAPVENFASITEAFARNAPLSLSTDLTENNITVPDGVDLIGINDPVILLSLATENIFNLAGKANICGIVFDLTGTTGNDTFGTVAISNQNDCSETYIRFCKFKGQAKRPYISLSPSAVFNNVAITDNEFVGPYAADEIKTEFLGGGVRILAGSLGNTNITIERNEFSRIASNSVQMRYSGGDIHTPGCFVNLSVSFNKCFEPGFSSVSGHTWFETISVNNYTCHGNRLFGGGRGLSCGTVKSGSFVGNTMTGLYSYGCEMGHSESIVFSDNTLLNCNNFISDNGNTGIAQSSDVTITGNTIVGGNRGLVGWNNPSLQHAISLNVNDEGYFDWHIVGNTFKNWESGDHVVDVNGSALTSGFTISGNKYSQRTELSEFTFVKFRHGSNHVCKDNAIYRYSNVSDATGSGAKSSIGYQVNAGCDDLEISGNKISFKGTDTRTVTANIDGISQNASAGSLTNFVVKDNLISGAFTRPLNIVANDGDTIVTDNDTTGSTGTNAINSNVIYQRTRRVANLSNLPTTGSWNSGDKIYRTGPSGGGSIGWVCITSGTFGGTDPVFKTFGTIAV
tara:strand:- start:6198 stop:8075 length:1878 start_codon:yes stop_codon:yes gene_type:complete